MKLERRGEFDETIGQRFRDRISLGRLTCQGVVSLCQDLFIDELDLPTTIAKNDALKENVWMMSICMELRIPLFLVGKPGSSKTLAKTVVVDVMQGNQLIIHWANEGS